MVGRGGRSPWQVRAKPLTTLSARAFPRRQKEKGGISAGCAHCVCNIGRLSLHPKFSRARTARNRMPPNASDARASATLKDGTRVSPCDGNCRQKNSTTPARAPPSHLLGGAAVQMPARRRISEKVADFAVPVACVFIGRSPNRTGPWAHLGPGATPKRGACFDVDMKQADVTPWLCIYRMKQKQVGVP
jgi:hypothetical protein